MPRSGGEEDRLPSVVYGHPWAAISIASCFSLIPAPSRGTPLLFSGSSPRHSWRCGLPGVQPHGLSRLAAETLLTPGRWNDPCTTCPPGSPLLWDGRLMTSGDRRDRPVPSPAISRTTCSPSSSEYHALDTLPPCPATRTPGPHCPRNTTHSNVPLSESVSIRLLRLAGPGAIKNRATQERAQRLGRVGPQRLLRHPAGTEGSTPPGPAEAVETPPRGRCVPARA